MWRTMPPLLYSLQVKVICVNERNVNDYTDYDYNENKVKSTTTQNVRQYPSGRTKFMFTDYVDGGGPPC